MKYGLSMGNPRGSLSQSTSDQWIPSKRANFYTAGLLVVGPLLTLAFGATLILFVGTNQVGGLWGAVAIIVGVILMGWVLALFLLESWKPNAVRSGADGVEVRTFFGRYLLVAWNDVSIGKGGRAGWGVARLTRPSLRFMALEPRQYEALKATRQDTSEPEPLRS